MKAFTTALLLSLISASLSLAQNNSAAGNFDFYILALSWSPAFCEREGYQKRRPQCFSDQRHGFVVHGLWPQNISGYPSFCTAFERSIPRQELEKAARIFPDINLARHQWRKHGTCTGKSPSAYFDDTVRAREMVVIPDLFVAPDKNMDLSAREIERAFTDANKGLRADMIRISCSRYKLTEIRICLDKNLKNFQSCEEIQKKECRNTSLEIIAKPH